jgi:hypothetical protein
MDKNIGSIAVTLLDVLNQLKIYHWQTKSYARHKASDELISNLTSSIDQIVEIMQGKKNTRLFISDSNDLIRIQNQNDNDIIELLGEFKTYLVMIFPRYLTNKDTDILNIRDDLLGNVNKTLYLFSLD